MNKSLRVAPALALLCAIACNAGGRGDAPIEDALVRAVEKGDLVEEVVESGRIAPVYEVDIKSRVSGEVSEVLAEEGDLVKLGQPLLRLDPTDYKRQVALSEIDVEEATLNLKNAQTELERNQQALDARGISQSEFDLALRQVELSEVRLKRTQAALETARDQLRYTSIVAPMDGTVIRREVDPGELITAGLSATVNGAAQMTIARIDRLLLELDLNQVDVAKVRVGHKARILLDAYPGTEIMGDVTNIAAAGHTDASKGIDVFEVRVELDPSQTELEIKPGMTAEVRILTGEHKEVIKVPAETVFEENGKSWIYVIKDDPANKGKRTKEKVEVTVGHRGGREVEITSGVAAGDRIYARAEVKNMNMMDD